MPAPPKPRSSPRAPRSVPAVGSGQDSAHLPLPRMQTRFSLPLRLPAIAAGAVLLAHAAMLVAVLASPRVFVGSPLILLGLSLATGMALSGAALWAVGRWVGERIDRITDVLERTQLGDYTRRLDEGLNDDVGQLARRVNLLVQASAARERRIMESALSDPLTGLPNRTLLTERIRHSLATARRSRQSFAVAVLDLDRFKVVNDTLGHATGDMVLREVAQRLRATVRDSDTVARLGGDEFVLLLQGGEDAAREVVSRILETMKTPLLHRDQRIDIGLSIGVAIHPEHGSDDLTLLRHADAAMYRAKRRRAGVELFDGESHEVSRSYLSLLGELRSALETGQFTLDYQPKLDLASGRIVGLEGLVRWNHPIRGRVSPGEFIPFAEQTGFMREITRWVVHEGARFSAELARRGLELNLSVNVSAQDIENPSFSAMVADIVRDQRIEGGRLTLEITESGLLSETDNALGNLRAIGELGIRLSVDDFGTGYATLKQLQQLPVHELKIDRSFVCGMTANRGNQTIVKSTVDLGKQLGLRVVAEGVETIAELRALSAMGCDEIQGYYLSQPMAPNDVIPWLEMRQALYASSRDSYFQMLVKP
jgi:diguanylate cyclase (GGDEF)-like protein